MVGEGDDVTRELGHGKRYHLIVNPTTKIVLTVCRPARVSDASSVSEVILRIIHQQFEGIIVITCSERKFAKFVWELNIRIK